jgi:hypothetical protein
VDCRGQKCTLYPVSWQEVLQSKDFSPGWYADSFQNALVAYLTGSGLTPLMPAAGTPDQPIVITTQIIRADPGSRAMRWAFTLLAGHAVFEVQGLVGTATAPFGQFHAKGVRRWGWYGGDSEKLLSDAAKLAGESAAYQILTILAAR